jgi:hypothetical protein
MGNAGNKNLSRPIVFPVVRAPAGEGGDLVAEGQRVAENAREAKSGNHYRIQ